MGPGVVSLVDQIFAVSPEGILSLFLFLATKIAAQMSLTNHIKAFVKSRSLPGNERKTDFSRSTWRFQPRGPDLRGLARRTIAGAPLSVLLTPARPGSELRESGSEFRDTRSRVLSLGIRVGFCIWG